MPPLQRTHAAFHTTRWTLVQRLNHDDPHTRRQAAEQLATIYWPPVYAFIRRRGFKREHAAELTQGFFADVLLARELLERADPAAPGRLRSFILKAVQNYIIDRHRSDKARGHACNLTLSAIEREERLLPHTEPDPERAFERRWALGAIERSIARCHDHFARTGRHAHWELFHERFLQPALAARPPRPLNQIAHKHGFATPAEAASATQVVKKRFLAFLQEEAAAIDADPRGGAAILAIFTPP